MYEGGQVFVAPAEGHPQEFQLGVDLWTPTGALQPQGSVLAVRPADAIHHAPPTSVSTAVRAQCKHRGFNG